MTKSELLKNWEEEFKAILTEYRQVPGHNLFYVDVVKPFINSLLQAKDAEAAELVKAERKPKLGNCACNCPDCHYAQHLTEIGKSYLSEI